MRNICFQIIELQDQSFFQKIFKQYQPEDSIVALNNMLATKEIKSITQQDIVAISRKYNINIRQEYKKNIIEFYATYLNFAVTGKKITEDEFDNINHLKQLFNIDERIAKQIHVEITGKIYKNEFEKVLASGNINQKEREFLLKLQTELRLDTNIVENISTDLTSDYFEKYSAQLFKKERISQTEYSKLNSVIDNLKITVSKEKQELISKYKRYSEIENVELQEKIVETKLSKGEICYFQENSGWLENKGRKQSIENTTKEIKKVDVSCWNYVNSGKLHFTNKRILLTSLLGNKIVKLEKIITIIPFLDGVQIVKDAGKDVFIQTDRDSTEVSIILNKIINN